MADGLADTGRAVLTEIGAANLTPEQGTRMLGALATLARIVEVDELTRRVAALEAAQEGADAAGQDVAPAQLPATGGER